MKILILNGPNLNLLGSREPDKYGSKSLTDINSDIYEAAKKLDIEVDFFQSNIEGEIVDKIQQAKGAFDAVIINPAGYSYTSVAIRDAILAVSLPVVEVHLTNINSREEFRKNSIIAEVCIGQISGFQENVYKLGLIAFKDYFERA